MTDWTSPDGKIRKQVLQSGKWGVKPSEGSQCTITIRDSPLLEEYTNSMVTVGDNDGDLWRALDICLCTMTVGEKSKFILVLNDNSISLVVELIDLSFGGFIYEWDALKKYNLAMHHKEKGNHFFKSKSNKEAAFRYSKALKILHSIPIDVEGVSSDIDGVPLNDINSLKGSLYNNLSSCYLRIEKWGRVLDLCNKVLTFDSENVKALYKLGVAYENDRNFEKACDMFMKVLAMEPGNRACAEHLSVVREEMRAAEIKMNKIMKKMMSASMDICN